MEKKIKTENNFERKSNFLEIKGINNLGKFYGYASVFNVKDSYNDIILPSAFKNSLKSNEKITYFQFHSLHFDKH